MPLLFHFVLSCLYDENGKRISLNYPNGIKTNYSYDDADRVVTISTGTDADPALIEKVDYAYDTNSNRTSRIDKAGTHNYIYDVTSQLTAVTYPDGETQNYTFDVVGNRLEFVKEDANGKETITSVFNELNQLKRTENSNYEGGDIISLSGIIEDENIDKIIINGKVAKIKDDVYSLDELKLKPGVNIVTVEVTDLAENTVSEDYTFILDDKAKATYSYDANGNLKTKSEKGMTWTFKWDAENHLTKADSSEGKTVEYGWYDNNRNRIAFKKVENIITNYIYDGNNCIAKYDSNGNLIQELVYGAFIDEVLMRHDSDNTNKYFHQDGINSVIAITDDSGTKVASYEYNVYGKIKNKTGSLENEIQFTGRWFDEDTGLHYYRARWYNSDSGRFVSRDPIGLSSGDVNFYRYVKNNPSKFIDPFGLIEICFPLPSKISPWKDVSGPYNETSWHGDGHKDDEGTLGWGIMVWTKTRDYDQERTFIKRKLCYICSNGILIVEVREEQPEIDKRTITRTEIIKTIIKRVGWGGYTTENPNGQEVTFGEGDSDHAYTD